MQALRGGLPHSGTPAGYTDRYSDGQARAHAPISNEVSISLTSVRMPLQQSAGQWSFCNGRSGVLLWLKTSQLIDRAKTFSEKVTCLPSRFRHWNGELPASWIVQVRGCCGILLSVLLCEKLSCQASALTWEENREQRTRDLHIRERSSFEQLCKTYSQGRAWQRRVWKMQERRMIITRDDTSFQVNNQLKASHATGDHRGGHSSTELTWSPSITAEKSSSFKAMLTNKTAVEEKGTRLRQRSPEEQVRNWSGANCS